MMMYDTLTMEILLPKIQGQMVIAFVLWCLVFTAIFIDLWDRVYTQNKLHKPVRSHKMRITFDKMSEYWRVLLIALLIDLMGILFPFYSLPFASCALSIGLILTEAKSIMEHARERKSQILELKELSDAIISCSDHTSAKEVIAAVIEYIDKEKK